MGRKGVANRLQANLERIDFTIEEMLEAAHEILAELVPRQTRYKVTERPDVRTIRYYISQGLLPKPVSYEGGRARYSGRHLLRLLLIKKMQAEHHTLQKARGVLARLSDDEVVNRLLPEQRITGEKPQNSQPQVVQLMALKEQHLGFKLRRLHLSFGVNFDIPEDVFEDPGQLRTLAEELERLAQNLKEDKPS